MANNEAGLGDDGTSQLQDLKGIPIGQLSTSVTAALNRKQRKLDVEYYNSGSSFLALHSEVQLSLSLLDSLSSFLSSFQKDLSHVSGHISDLQDRSHALDARLVGRRQLDRLLSNLIGQVALSPRLVDLFFDSEPKQGGWLEACEDLERVLDQTQSVAQLASNHAATAAGAAATTTTHHSTPMSAVLPSTPSGGTAAATESAANAAGAYTALPPESRILLESRTLALSCLSIAVRKLRPYLISYFHPFKTQISTNLQVLQTSVLLKPAHRNLYAFLARQAPRVAIDVQRVYLAAARLYFETGFRRYTRALEKIRARSVRFSGSGGRAGAGEQGAGDVSASIPAAAKSSNLPAAPTPTSSAGSAADMLIGDTSPSSMSAVALSLLARAGGGSATAKYIEQLDKEDKLFILDDERFAQSQFDGPGVVLAYMADNPFFKATPEVLFRSMALTFLDNACSEYTFLVRFFESLPPPRHKAGPSRSLQGDMRSAMAASVTPRTSIADSSRPSLDLSRSGGGSRASTFLNVASPTAEGASNMPMTPAAQQQNRQQQHSKTSQQPPHSARTATSVGTDYTSPAPEESASVFGGRAEDHDGEDESGMRSAITADGAFEAEGSPADDFGHTIVRLTLKEQRARKGKGVEDELWKQVMEPVLGHWTTFTKALLSSTPPPPLLSLLCMVKLNEALMAAATARGAASVLQGPLLTFKINAWPLIQRSFDEHIGSLRKMMTNYGISTAGRSHIGGGSSNISGGGSSTGSSTAGTAATAAGVVAGLTSWSGLTGLVNAAANATSNFSTAEKLAMIRLVCTRYARLFLSLLQLSDEQNETMLFGSVQRLRDEVEWLAKEGAKVVAKEQAKKDGAGVQPEMEILADYYDAVCKVLSDPGGRVSASLPRVQSELSHWTELRIALVS
ncbi:hypothetical protein K437DRAFT_270609 [Tilletiaria anomala UBC 951]|uniref:Vps52-domain-containing protein n=1 Tax=Tilletiaria anomala (strain ATCC 24038 / CBS 436.72 / UBC 951) TaxID=1037660 RepID=A0A066V946_TILAU|nr:uncharacterized protein K437DRAFT_270609 [Tilletiaria anomala UBC 951]KDN38262.1 hypothetical protein K437DRAFT_270609 [Tilletiaria anomala UBC 951]